MKRVLDACCGSRMFYFDRQNPDVIYADNREVETTLCDGRTLLIKPDMRMDFRKMPYKDHTFKVVVFDPPHLIHAGTGSWLASKYGILPKAWPEYLKQYLGLPHRKYFNMALRFESVAAYFYTKRKGDDGDGTCD